MKKSLILAILLFQVGCNSSPNIERDKRVNFVQKYPHVIILGDQLQKEIQISKASERYIEEKRNRHKEVMIEVNSTIDTENMFEYRFVWYDSEGFEVGTAMSIWEEHWIQGRSLDRISEPAPSPRVETYKCYLKKPE